MLEIPIHRKTMINILEALYSSSYWKYLWFKWWTLAYFLYWLDRFSTDLDFDIIEKIDNEWAFMNWIENILSKFGKIKDKKNKKRTYFFLVDYWEWEMNIKIEINKRLRKNDIFEIQNIFGISATCMSKSSAFTNKLIALTERKIPASRDLYDVYYFLRESFPINEKLLFERSWKTTIEYLFFTKEFITSKFNKKNILAEIWEVLDNKQKYFVKNEMIDKIIWLIDFRLFEIEKWK